MYCVQLIVEQLRQMCLDERVGQNGPEGRNYSALTQSPREWGLEAGKPCSGERLLLMFDRWCAGSHVATQFSMQEVLVPV